jgi:diaminohydroxyphosphoribosylaminopyrimidine deaminase/5-amino-6-(5-phosphoribosylamino)uracil reductase
MTDREYMQRALDLAERGRGLASPGALVGAVVVHDGSIVGEGFYTWDGEVHAEAQALRIAGESARGATLYVTLEPCSHHGRTPPCVSEVIRAGVRRVVAATRDPNPLVDGSGIEALRGAGVVVEFGTLEAEAAGQNEAHLHAMKRGRPFGVLKAAMSLDGKIATRTGESQWITSPESRERAHQLRHRSDAILTGSGTVLRDDPMLTDRSGRPRRRPLVRAVVDRRARVMADRRLFSEPGAILYTGTAVEVGPDAECVPGLASLEEVFADLGRRGVQSVLIECGPEMASSALRSGIVDKIVVFVAPKIFGGRDTPVVGGPGIGVLGDAVALDRWTVEPAGPDLMISAYVHRDH